MIILTMYDALRMMTAAIVLECFGSCGARKQDWFLEAFLSEYFYYLLTQQNVLCTHYVPDIVLGTRGTIVNETQFLPRGTSSPSFNGCAELALHLCDADHCLYGWSGGTPEDSFCPLKSSFTGPVIVTEIPTLFMSLG